MNDQENEPNSKENLDIKPSIEDIITSDYVTVKEEMPNAIVKCENASENKTEGNNETILQESEIKMGNIL